MIALGDAFWAQNPNSNNPPHLYFVISDPRRNAGHVLLVNMTERRAGSDESCLLLPGVHSCVKKESVIQYAEAIFPEARMVEHAVYKGVFVAAAHAEMPLVRRMLEGALASRHLRMKYRAVVAAELEQLGHDL
ncbi:MAG: hypothetical protein HY646_01100 [Acidobacteria bacterium]|nr:hypothetical protein [Acidobacteriota bacterium]